ncbi:Pathogenicity locus [Pseudoxanthomonas kalamensis DSM 18571]|uniref:helix-hairpin-helix domain-containing protein n=1 Tax=Pseudoxanthomonas kalamensis TaxID=289483 RepID=UPI001390FB01|nr:helix-hairpin-helix domain-containing protein [Pseudoxanthomonas kalamensis]KAF1709304.1 Pathogenicity locus [Pseudoxanthomonas kalamensis DSM 18571]
MGFPAAERATLLAVKGVGPTVVDRLEQIGYGSLQELAGATPEDITRQIAAMLGTTCWRNSPQARAAITAAIAAAQAQSAASNTSAKKSAIAR